MYCTNSYYVYSIEMQGSTHDWRALLPSIVTIALQNYIEDIDPWRSKSVLYFVRTVTLSHCIYIHNLYTVLYMSHLIAFSQACCFVHTAAGIFGWSSLHGYIFMCMSNYSILMKSTVQYIVFYFSFDVFNTVRIAYINW